MNFLKYTVPVFFALFLALFSGCHEEETLSNLQKDVAVLEMRADSLYQEIDRLKKTPSDVVLLSDTVQPGNGPYAVLERMNISRKEMAQLVNTLLDSVDMGKLKVGQRFYALVDSAAHAAKAEHSVKVFRYQENAILVHLVHWVDSGFVYKKVEKPFVRKQSVYEGVLEKGGTLDGMLFKSGIPQRMRGVVSGVLQCKIAFQSAQPGDRFRVLLEDTFDKDGVWVSGKVIYAEFDGRVVGHHEAFLYFDGDPKSSFNAHYTENGEALIFNGLRYPLDKIQIGSRFGKRLHPILGEYRLHAGVDYRASMGSPVYAVADGVVTVSGYDDASGNKIAIKHSDGFVSYYMHLSQRSVSVGTHVAARQFIGKVGSTGRSTGPHLHFGFKNPQGQWIDPLTKTMIATPKLAGERLAKLQGQVKDIRKEIELTLQTPAVKANDTTDVMVHVRALN